MSLIRAIRDSLRFSRAYCAAPMPQTGRHRPSRPRPV